MDPVLSRISAALADRYRVERELGSGGTALVFLAEDLKHHRRVAIKVLRPELAATLGPERFLREIEIAAQLEHPHILTLIDSGTAAGLLFFSALAAHCEPLGSSTRTPPDQCRRDIGAPHS
ncbi:MAG TPA: protein kinase [Gemmatimonadales bacterium]